MTNKPKHPTRGFAGMTPERRREIARMGGKALSADKRTFSTNRTLAQEAGRKGGIGGRNRHAKRSVDA